MASKTIEAPTIEALQARIEELEAQLAAKPKGLSGYLVRTPAPFNGPVSGLIFRNGVAFVPKSEAADKLVRDMANDLGYAVEPVEDFVELATSDAALSKSMIDLLAVPALH